MLAGGDIGETPSAQRHRRAWDPEHEAVIRPGGDGTLQIELNPALCSRLDRILFKKNGAATDLDSAGVQRQRSTMPERSR